MATETKSDSQEQVVQIRRCACVVKGGRRFSFAAMVVVGNHKGEVGWGYGKGNEVPTSVEKAVKDCNHHKIRVNLNGDTIPHQIEGRFGSARVLLLPANPGTGIIAGASVRAVVESVGIKDILTKVRGSTNPINVVKATFDALSKLRNRDDFARLRGVDV
ncbi:30S ribosomal protein S5 [Rubinisphaera italica]|mgnify:FL=1|uniref:Small ribosomal subunit protein uS5 n=1 Tax=Rubinisphaera italica TaxID=2527969 RepID=A0A5C5XKL3_9PLAN|nr:30S ribosomal protein S5 [Rubinisphaera italica]TWT63079.1 30S ribosomal protein S5 [Rubinisphaera italica]HBN77495.1 30S ribosomal protein S5 [Planctomycetaceae bacterium]